MTQEERGTLAGEYVLGLLDPADGARCDTLTDSDPEFAALVEEWRRRMLEIDLSAEPQPPTADLWARIERSIARRAALSHRRRPAPPPGPLAALWQSLPLWRGIGIAAAAAVLVLGVSLALQLRVAAGTPILVAVLVAAENRPTAIVNAFRDGRVELVPIAPLVAPAGRSLQVWTLWDRARGPVSVGLLDAMRSLPLDLRGLPGAVPEQLFEVTLEPAGGSPTGRPTGPILMKGTASLAL